MVQIHSDEENEEGQEMICAYPSFNGKLLSVTWTDTDHLLFLFDNRKGAVVPRGLLGPSSWTHIGEKNLSEVKITEVKVSDTDLEFTEENRGFPLKSYYLLNEKGNFPVLFSNEKELVVVGGEKSFWEKTVLGEWFNIEKTRFTHHFESGKSSKEVLVDNQFSIVHDRSKKEIHGWILELPKPPKSPTLRIYNLWLNDFKLHFEKIYPHFALLYDGSFMVAGSEEELMGYVKSKQKLATFTTRPPRGMVDYTDGTLYLLDDEKGCVYSVLGWGHINLGQFQLYEEIKNFRAFGTPFEEFFHCMNVKPKGISDPNRCDIGGEMFRITTPSSSVYYLSIDANEGTKLSSTGHLNHLFWVLSVGGGTIPLLLLVLFFYYFCSKKKNKKKEISKKNFNSLKNKGNGRGGWDKRDKGFKRNNIVHFAGGGGVFSNSSNASSATSAASFADSSNASSALSSPATSGASSTATSGASTAASSRASSAATSFWGK